MSERGADAPTSVSGTPAGTASDRARWDRSDEAGSDRAIPVRLAASARTLFWRPEHETLLGLLRAEGAPTPSQCRQGTCGTCAVRLVEGRVVYRRAVSASRPDDHVLTCSCLPDSELVLDL